MFTIYSYSFSRTDKSGELSIISTADDKSDIKSANVSLEHFVFYILIGKLKYCNINIPGIRSRLSIFVLVCLLCFPLVIAQIETLEK